MFIEKNLTKLKITLNKLLTSNIVMVNFPSYISLDLNLF